MSARSFIGTAEEAARRFYATALRGEVSDANVRGYLRAATQIETTWQAIDTKVAEALTLGVAPWDAYSAQRYALAFIRAARAYQVFVRELLAADAAADPATTGYLPRITFDQANALCLEILPNLQHAVAALTEPGYEPGEDAPPLALAARIQPEVPSPLPHLRGIIAAAREVREWAAGLLAEYERTIAQVSMVTPDEIAHHCAELHSMLAQADASLLFGTDLLGQPAGAGTGPELRDRAEESLWEAMRGFFLLNQAVAFPGMLHPVSLAPARKHIYLDRRIQPKDLWQVAAPSARAHLRGKLFATKAMAHLCQQMGGVLSAEAQRFLDEVQVALAEGDAQRVSVMASCPFEPIYRARHPLTIAGAQVPAGYEFHWSYPRGRVEAVPRYERVATWQKGSGGRRATRQ